MGGKNETKRVPSPESVPSQLNKVNRNYYMDWWYVKLKSYTLVHDYKNFMKYFHNSEMAH